MTQLNPYFSQLTQSYLFPRVEKEVQKLKQKDPNQFFCNLGIGDCTQPLAPIVVESLVKASQELLSSSTFKGYGPSQGYPFLRKAIQDKEYPHFSWEEIFIGDGAKCHLARLLALFSPSLKVGICDPAYPVYIDSAVLMGWAGNLLANGQYENLTYIPLLEENDFLPIPPQKPLDLVFLCSPNNPTGASLPREKLQMWVEYAQANNTILLYDGAYTDFITSEAPQSIFEIPGAKKVAIEVRSFSKKAGFTGLRCSYSVVPQELQEGKIHAYWNRLLETTFGGVSYPIQKAALSIYSEEGQKQIESQLKCYQKRALFLRESLQNLNFSVWGGIDAPYVWLKAPNGLSSWEFFHKLLQKQIISIPGSGFGLSGEGFVRFSAFAEEKILQKAMDHLSGMSLCAL